MRKTQLTFLALQRKKNGNEPKIQENRIEMDDEKNTDD